MASLWLCPLATTCATAAHRHQSITTVCPPPRRKEGQSRCRPRHDELVKGRLRVKSSHASLIPETLSNRTGGRASRLDSPFFSFFFSFFFLKKNYSLPTLTLQWKAGRQSASGFRSLDRPTAARGTVCALNVHVSTEQNGGGLFLLLVVVVPPPSFEVALAFHKWTNGLTGRERTHAPTHPHPPFPPRARDDGWGQRASGWI